MTESDEGRPLSRREIRLREMAATGSLPTAEPPQAVPETPAQGSAGDLDISPFHPDGTPRTRREMRELREIALAEQGDLEIEQTQAFTPQDFEEAIAAAGSDFEDEDGDEETAEPAEQAETKQAEPGQAEAETEPIESRAAGGPVSEPTSGYSFPDIAPLDEGASIFDDPALRTAPRPNGAQATGGDFDDLISRAVAQEGAAGTTNASALILPNMGHTGQLSGPIGETGELFITGSIDLPKSLGETGGHAALLDSVQGDPDDIVLGEHPGHHDDAIAPVSAAKAVSARAASTSVVAAPEKEKSKLPLVLIATGGGLLVVIAGLAIWAVSSGFFA